MPNTVPPACYFLLPSHHWDRPGICHLLQLWSSLFDRVVQLCGTPLPGFRYKVSSFCLLLIRSEKDITAIAILSVLTKKGSCFMMTLDKGWFICRFLGPGAWAREEHIGFRIRVCPGMSPPYLFSALSPLVPTQA